MGSFGRDHSINVNCCTETKNANDVGIRILEEEMVECRICGEEELPFKLEAPCACSGTVKYVHHKCVQQWCNIKGNTVCEICHQAYKGGYTAIPRCIDEEDQRGSIVYPITRDEQNSSFPSSAVEEFYLETRTRAGLAFCCSSASFVMLALVFLQHLISIKDGMHDDNSHILFMIFLFRTTGFLLLCYITAGAARILRRDTWRHWDHEGAIKAREAIFYFIFLTRSFLFVRIFSFYLYHGCVHIFVNYISSEIQNKGPCRCS